MESNPSPLVPRPFLICFDLDGVLYSAEPFLGEAYRETIALVNERRPGSFERVPSTREILDHVGWPVPVMLQRLFPHVDQEAVALLRSLVLDVISRRVAAGEGRLYPQVAEVLRALRSQYVLAIASNGRSRYVETVLATYGLADLFVPRVDAERMGDKAAVLRHYLRELGATRERTVMIGDRTSDVEAAREVGCPFVGCDYGHGYRNEIEGAGPIVAAFAELPDSIDALLAARDLSNR